MRIVFMGTPAFAVAAVDALARAGHAVLAVVAQPDRPAGRGQALRAPATKAWAEAHGVPVLQPEKVRDGRLAAELRALSPDVLVVAAYGRILGKDLLELAPRGAVNVHGSLLPRWRGAAPIQWAIAAGDAETGVSIMQMDEGLDTGDVLLQRVLPIGPGDTAETLAPRLAALGGEALVEALALAEAGKIAPVRQDGAQATHARILEKEDGRIDWSRPAAELAARLRGFTPWPGAWTTLDGKVLKVVAAEVVDQAPGPRLQASGRAAGTPTATVSGPALLVPCGGGTALRLLRVKLEGKGEQAGADLAHGLRRRELVLGA
jgi:methionyl-tRNA formyltransferase